MEEKLTIDRKKGKNRPRWAFQKNSINKGTAVKRTAHVGKNKSRDQKENRRSRK